MDSRSRRWTHAALTTFVGSSALALSGCCAFSNSGECSGDDGSELSPTPGGVDGGQIATLNQNPPTDMTEVTLIGRVTAINYKGNFWIEDAEGGLYSGIYIFDKDLLGTGAGVAVGDEVEVKGLFQVYFDVNQLTLYADSGGLVTIRQKNAGIPPVLAVSDLGTLEASACTTDNLDENLKPYIGVLVSLPEATITSDDGTCADAAFGMWKLQDADGDTVVVDDDIDIPYAPVAGAVAEVTGVYTYTYQQHKLMATAVHQLSGPVVEDWEISELNQASPDNAVVTTRGIVTAISYEGNFWIQDAEDREYAGIYVFDKDNKKGESAGIEIGDEVEVTALFTTYFDLRELKVYEEEEQGQVTILTKAAGVPAPLEMDLSDLQVQSICSTEVVDELDPYIGMVLELPTTTVTTGVGACESNPSFGVWEVQDEAGNRQLVDDDTYDEVPSVGAVINLTGVLHYSFSQYKIEPTAIEVLTDPGPQLSDIYTLNQTPPSNGTSVTVTGRVTALTSSGSFWIAEPEGGLYSGIYVFDKDGQGQDAGVKVGDEVEVAGQFQVFYEVRQISVYTDSHGVVTIKEAGAGAPAPLEVPDLATLEPSACTTETVDAGLEPYIGVLVHVQEATAVTDDACTNPDYGTWLLQDADGDALVVDDGAGLKYTPEEGEPIEIAGIFTFSFSQHKIQATEVNGEGSTEPPPEETLTIVELNQTAPEDAIVTTSGVVTALTGDGSFWIQDPTAQAWAGIYVYDRNEKKGQAAGIAVGDAVTVLGVFETFYGLREISIQEEEDRGQVTITQKDAGAPAPLELTMAQLQVEDLCTTEIDADLEPFVSMRISLPTTTVSSGFGACETDTGNGIWEVEDADEQRLLVASDLLNLDPTVGTEVDLTGLLTYEFSQYRLQATVAEGLSEPPPPEETSLIDLNQTPPEEGTVVTATGIVTGLATNGDFWLQDAAGGAYSGLQIYDTKQKKGIAAGIKAGDKVRVTGVWDIFKGVRQLAVYQEVESGKVELLEASVGLPPSLVIEDLSELEVDNLCEGALNPDLDRYIGIVLALPVAEVVSGMGACGESADFGKWTVEDESGDQLLLDDRIAYTYEPTVGQLVTVTGILTYAFEQHTLNPLGDASIVVQAPARP